MRSFKRDLCNVARSMSEKYDIFCVLIGESTNLSNWLESSRCFLSLIFSFEVSSLLIGCSIITKCEKYEQFFTDDEMQNNEARSIGLIITVYTFDR